MVIFITSNNLFAQPGHNLVKQPSRINGVARAIANANVNAKIHANSNSVFGTGNTHPNYNKKDQSRKEVAMDDGDIKKAKAKKQKK